MRVGVADDFPAPSRHALIRGGLYTNSSHIHSRRVKPMTDCQPPNEKDFYLMVALVNALGIFWSAFENKRFEGPPTSDRIKERQKMIAEIEKQYSDQ